MRTAFMNALFESAAVDPRVTLVVGDLGYSVVERFAAAYPKQFLNAGVAEQNMTGLAAGLALSGRIVVTYSIGNFPTLRCLEQIRNDICYHHANVKIVAVGGGYAYGALGVSHHATEDLAIMRALPHMTVVAPGDPLEAAAAATAILRTPGPAYVRLGKAGEPRVHTGGFEFELGRAIVLKPPAEVTVIATGGMLPIAVAAADALAERYGVTVGVISMHTLRPLDTEIIRRVAAQTGLLVTLEEHSIVGGLGGAVAEVLSEMDASRPRLLRVGLPSEFCRTVGDQQFLRSAAGLSPDAVADRIASYVASADEAQT